MMRWGGSCLDLLLLVISSEVFGGRPAGRRGGGVGGEGKEVRWKTAMVEVVRSSKEKNQEDGLVVGAIFNGKGILAACSVLVDGEGPQLLQCGGARFHLPGLPLCAATLGGGEREAVQAV